ncbi:hypothetical protein PAMP_007850 [Pampus punctatissimus]
MGHWSGEREGERERDREKRANKAALLLAQCPQQEGVKLEIWKNWKHICCATVENQWFSPLEWCLCQGGSSVQEGKPSASCQVSGAPLVREEMDIVKSPLIHERPSERG